ncbi:sulfatase [Thalassoglobus sp.]|uniref:sulfatase family protein n=1 Tax=Thalassoglobus sp. TaxID=2795869 RepID=UPI003AA7C045
MVPTRMDFVAITTLITMLSGTVASSFAEGQPNVLMIVSEDNGPELGCYGDAFARTPTLDRLASEGVRFENAFVPYSVCSPSRAAFLTGLHPHQNGQIGLATHKFAMYDKETPNVATHLNAAGYYTGLIGKLHVNPESAFPFDSHQIPSSNFQRKQSVADYAAAAKKFISEAGEKPFFLSVNFPDAHLPFIRKVNGRPLKPLNEDEVQPMPWIGVNSPRLREQVANYYNCLERLDSGVEMLLDTLAESGHAENTLVIYFGDHGAQFPRGKGTVYEGGLRVPMIVRWPGQTKAGTVREELVSTLDVLPTILTAAGLDVPKELPGLPLQPLLRNETPESWRQFNFALTTGSFPRACFVQHSVRDARYKLISSPHPNTENLDANTYLDEKHPHYVISGATAEEQLAAPAHVQQAFALWSKPPRFELYDLKNDPYEWNNLAENPDHAEALNRLKTALSDWQSRTRDPFILQKNVDDYVSEQLANRDFKYRKMKDFRWSYIDDFAKWRNQK